MEFNISKDTPVTVCEVAMDYVYIRGIETTLGEALSEIAAKNEEDGMISTHHILLYGDSRQKVASVVSSVVLYGENCGVDNDLLASILFENGDYGFEFYGETWNTQKSITMAKLAVKTIPEIYALMLDGIFHPR